MMNTVVQQAIAHWHFVAPVLTEPLIGKCDVLIGVHVNSMSKKTEHLHIRDILDRSFHFALSHSVYSKVDRSWALYVAVSSTLL